MTKIEDLSDAMIDVLVKELRNVLQEVTPEQRVYIFNKTTEGYCPHCGGTDRPCYCENDD